MKAKIALFLSLLLAFSLLADGIDVRTDLDDDAEEEASSIDALVISLRFKDSGRLRSRRTTTNSSALSGGCGVRSENFLSAARIRKPSTFSQQELYSLQQVYRL
ncbi:MAG TPA: hypothetical protein VGW77_09460 [Candidatus Binatia bacterium]|nr:hypothetical protein [Candidatus Binatia bacterium]